MSQTIKIEFLGEINLYFGMGILVLTSIFLGGLIGLEREIKMKAAGIKTNMLICLGSTIYTAISLLNIEDMGIGTADPNRTAAQVVSGIGFLGAGAILQARGEIVGLTTAATVWLVAAVGVAIGTGHPFMACFFTVTTIFVLRALTPFYKIFKIENTHYYEIVSETSVKNRVLSIFRSYKVEIMYNFEEKSDDQYLLYLEVKINPKVQKAISYQLSEVAKVSEVYHHVLTTHHDNYEN